MTDDGKMTKFWNNVLEHSSISPSVKSGNEVLVAILGLSLACQFPQVIWMESGVGMLKGA